MADSIKVTAIQYETYPYPPRDPKDEARRLITGSPSHLAEIQHYGFAGRLPQGRPFRALIAGGGTGDALVMLTQQLVNARIPAEITYLDLSRQSRSIAEARLKARNLKSVQFVTGSLLDAPNLAPGPWDYIDCCGVLHHLPNPDQGLHILASILAPNGVIGLMLYGELGRTGVYPLQRSLRLLTKDLPAKVKIEFTKRLLENLPETNWIKRNPFLGDHLLGEDAALYDLLLHGQDRAYRVPEIITLLDSAKLAIAAWIEPAKYDPATWVTSPDILAQIDSLKPEDRAALAEDLSGTMKSHVFYAVSKARAGQTVATLQSESMVPVLRDVDSAALARTLAKGGPLKVHVDGHRIERPIPAEVAEIVAIIDGHRSLDELAKMVTPLSQPFATRFQALYQLLNPLNLLLLKQA